MDRSFPAFEAWRRAMAMGDFELAWSLNDAYKSHWPSAHHLWDHSDLKGSEVEISSLHGFGDAVQMLRFAPRLRAEARTLRFRLPDALLPIAPFFDGVPAPPLEEEWNPDDRGMRPLRAEIMELPYLFRIQLRELPVRVPYLKLPTGVLQAASDRMGHKTRPRVGLVWSGGAWDPDRWVPVDLLRPLLEEHQFEWWNVQGGAATRQLDDVLAEKRVRRCGAGLVSLAATIANLDVLITIDTLAAHLAGAMGVPTLVLLKHNADWRWLDHCCDTPWYPSLTLFRQPEPGNWQAPIETVAETLQQRFAPSDSMPSCLQNCVEEANAWQECLA